MSARHKWSAPFRTANATDRACERCGLIKRTRHEDDATPRHWTEFWNGDARIVGEHTPACEPAREVEPA